MKDKNQKEKDKKTPVYIKCPRCELNYILSKEKHCDVCKAEMNLIDPNILIPEEEIEEVICPVCKINLMSPEEEMCFLCAKEAADKAKADEDEWSLPDAKEDEIIEDDELDIPLSAFDEEEQEEIEIAPEEQEPETDFDYVSVEELDEMEFDDEDEDDEW